jgi:hypothetical protein
MKKLSNIRLALISLLSISMLLIGTMKMSGQGCNPPFIENMNYTGQLDLCTNQQALIGVDNTTPSQEYRLYMNGTFYESQMGNGATMYFNPAPIIDGPNVFTVYIYRCGVWILWNGLPLTITGHQTPPSHSFSVITSPFCYCQHSAGTFRLSGSETGFTYVLMHYQGGTTIYIDTIQGTGNPIDFYSSDWDWGDYSVVASNNSAPYCQTEMGLITINPFPVFYYHNTGNINLTTATIYWNIYDVTCIDHLRIEVNSKSDFTGNIEHDSSSPSYTSYLDLTGLTPGQIHYCRVRAYGYICNSILNELTWSFTTCSDIIPIHQGWNLISSNVDLVDKKMMRIYDPGLTLIVKGDDDSLQWTYIPPWYYPNDTNFIWDYKQGYHVYSWNAYSLFLYEGDAVAANTPIQLDSGWQRVSYLPVGKYFANYELLPSLDSNLVIATNGNGQMYFPYFNINNLEEGTLDSGKMVHNEGYLIYVLRADTLIYPVGNPRINAEISNLTVTKTKYLFSETGNTGNFACMALVAKNLPDGTEIGVYNSNNIIIGSSVVNNGIAAITVWGVNPISNSSIGALSGEQLTLRALDIKTSRVYNLNIADISEITGKTKSDIINYIHNGVYIVTTNDSLIEYSLSIGNYPNPFQELTTIEWYLPEAGFAEISIYNLYGDKILNIASGDNKVGLYSSQFYNKSLISGCYNLVLRFGNQTVCKPFIIEK